MSLIDDIKNDETKFRICMEVILESDDENIKEMLNELLMYVFLADEGHEITERIERTEQFTKALHNMKAYQQYSQQLSNNARRFYE